MNRLFTTFRTRTAIASAVWLVCGLCSTPVQAAPAVPEPAANAAAALAGDDQRLIDARDAWRRRDKARLAQLRDALVAARHPLAAWADYWELNGRLDAARQDELDAFYARWPGTYVEDRLRNDWLLVLGRRRDWTNFSKDYARFQMRDDREVLCYALVARHLQGDDVSGEARAAWLAQRDGDDGCLLLGRTMMEARRFTLDDLWARARLAAENGRVAAARQSLQPLSDIEAAAVGDVFENPLRYLARKADTTTRSNAELTALAVARLAATDPAAAAAQLNDRWQAGLVSRGGSTAAWAWSAVAKQAAIKLLPTADGYFDRSAELSRPQRYAWNDETLAWRARAALRQPSAPRWSALREAIDAMSATEQRDPAWQYWRGRALLAATSPGTGARAAPAASATDPRRLEGQQVLEQLAGQLNFYGKLASDNLGRPQPLPARPAPPSTEERMQAEQHAGLTRALLLIAIGLRGEGVREWNFSLRDFTTDRQLLAAAQRACDREVWDRCINTSERTRTEVDMTQRFPTPFRAEVTGAAQKAGLDPALIYGLIRQESRFITDARSGVGASGLMQLMPATARWTAKRVGMTFSNDQITDRATNLELGTTYFKLLLDDFEGSQALATAGYNAGPNRPRRWRDGPVLEVAAWAENIPFNETRDYVKKVLSNASYYAALMAGRSAATLKPALAPAVGPRPPADPPENKDLP